jgi:hypothetical protein
MINQETGQFEYTPEQIEGVMWFLGRAMDEVREDEDQRWSGEQARTLDGFLRAKMRGMSRVAA